MTIDLEPFFKRLAEREKTPKFLLMPTKTMNFKKQNSWSVYRGAEAHELLTQTGIDNNELSLGSYLEATLLEDINAFWPFGVGYIPEKRDILTLNLEGLEFEFSVSEDGKYFHSTDALHFVSKGSYLISGIIVDNMGYDRRPSYFMKTGEGWVERSAT